MPPSALTLIRWSTRNGIHWIDLIYVLQSGWSSIYWSTALHFWFTTRETECPNIKPLRKSKYENYQKMFFPKMKKFLLMVNKYMKLRTLRKLLKFFSLTYLQL